MTRIAVIGAGISGLTLAHRLTEQADVTLFEKSRGVGGRMATRRRDGHHFDTGAQFFIARSRRFRQFLAPFRQSGTVLPWEPRLLTVDPGSRRYKRFWFEPHFIACPRMNDLVRQLASDQYLITNTRVRSLEQHSDGWYLSAGEGARFGPFDWVISTAPAPQSRELLFDVESACAWLADIHMSPCLCALVSLSPDTSLTWEVIQPRNSLIRWMADNSTKAGRPGAHSLVLHADNDWSATHFDDEVRVLETVFLEELDRLTGIHAGQITGIDLKRWRYARVEQAAETPFWVDPERGLGLCGDGGVGGSVEAAFTSADRLARVLSPVL